MSGPMSSPFTAIGRVESDVRSLEYRIDRKSDSSEVDSLKRQVNELESELTALKNDLVWLRERVTGLENREEERVRNELP